MFPPLILLAACSDEQSSFLVPGGPVAAAQRAHLIEVVAWTMIAILPVFIFAPLFLWRYRYRNDKARYSPDWDRSAPLEMLMWGVPFIIVAILATQLWWKTHALDPYKPIEATGAPISVQVVGLDWKWLFIYPEQGIASVNELAFPAGSSVALDLTTDTVMQSFMIPALAGQIYAMPGMRTRLHVLADAPGSYLGENTQWSGVGFAEQKFEARAMTPEAFAAWVAEVKAKGVALDASAYGRLAARSTGGEAHDALGTSQMPDGVIWFNRVETDLFQTVMHRYMQGAPVPPGQQPGAVGYAPPAAVTGKGQ